LLLSQGLKDEILESERQNVGEQFGGSFRTHEPCRHFQQSAIDSDEFALQTAAGQTSLFELFCNLFRKPSEDPLQVADTDSRFVADPRSLHGANLGKGINRLINITAKLADADHAVRRQPRRKILHWQRQQLPDADDPKVLEDLQIIH
jgi:hypothetical protein